MLVVISPAKNLDFESPLEISTHTQPDFLDKSAELIDVCKKLAPAKLSSLMKISDKLAGLNANRFASWHRPFSADNARPSILAFNGDVYAGLDAQTMTSDDYTFAQKHLRILSGLYGLLRPLDLMQPYRLEMGTKLETDHAKDLYGFWGNTITQGLNAQLSEVGSQHLINLASNEYFKSVKVANLLVPIITPVFKDEKNGQYKIISFYAKKARGLMARYIIENRLTKVEQLKQFDCAGYVYNAEQSSATTLVFTRPQQ